ncbi:MAG TPA: FAD-linked oxidase C-terminal domain-containing protein [Microthrixaceae bacterium]|nr:FAD-linked oxidase C-terminal domain-containing protein [Microthrixaceae bacterium]
MAREPTHTARASDDRRLVAELRGAIGADAVSVDPTARRLHRRDASTFQGVTPVAVCFPRAAEQVAAIIRTCCRHDRPFVTRGSGTGLAGGAVPLADAVVIVTTRMNRILEIDVGDRIAWVEPGVLNLDLARALEPFGLQFAPDPSSQAACSIGGNVANNSGGPHCLAAGVTSAHIMAVEVVLPDGDTVLLGGIDPEPDGLDLRGAFVGSEGTMGVATRIAVRLTPLPPAVRTLLAVFDDLDAAAAAVTSIIAAGVVPAALEMIDGPLAAAVEDYVGAGLPRDAAAVLLVELDGDDAGLDALAGRVRSLIDAHAAREVRIAVDDDERALWWKARKSAFGAIARIAPDYYLHDTVVPRRALVGVLRRVREIVEAHDLRVYNVFHAGDGNLHPLVVFDAREPGVMERVRSAGADIVAASLDAGGVLSGEHGIGIEKRDHMSSQFSDDDLRAQAWLREAFDPEGRSNPHKILPVGVGCAEIASVPDGVWV